MPANTHNADLHGNVPDDAKTALLIIDMINDFAFPDGEALLRYAMPVAVRIATLKQRARQAGVPAIYVNDNFGKWRSDFQSLVEQGLGEEALGRAVVQSLLPDDEDYFVLKPKHSGFFSTTLDLLLDYLKANTLILTGITGDICVLFTANDAYMRDFRLIVPADCMASCDANDNAHALAQMRKVLKANTCASTELDFTQLNHET
jgi:nicotinamidase-related amidase